MRRERSGSGGAVPEGGESGRPAWLFRPEDLGGPAPDPEKTRSDLERFFKGEAGAFERIWVRYAPALHFLISGRVRNGLDPALRARLDAETEDLLQEIGIRVLSKLPGFDYLGEGSLLAWMSQVATFVVQERVEYWRAGKRDPRKERALRDSTTTDAVPRGGPAWLRSREKGPSTAFDLDEKRRRIATALATLSDRHHTIAFLRFFGGEEWDVVAKAVGAPSADAVRMECYLKVLPALAAAMAAKPSAGA